MRIVLAVLIPLVLPFLCYSLWVYYRRRRGLTVPPDGPPLVWLGFAGIALVLLTLAGLSIQSHEPAGGRYVAPRMLPDGSIAPGHVER